MKKLTIKARNLCLILLVALVIRVFVLGTAWRNHASALDLDSTSYLVTAASLAAEGSFKTHGLPELIRTPGYPAFLAVCKWAGPSGYALAQVVQVLLDLLLVYLVYALGTRLGGRAAGLWAAGFQACSLVAILSSIQILSDGLFSLLITLAVLLLVQYFREDKWRFLALAAAVTAAATYVRPVGFIFVPVVVLVLLLRQRQVAKVAVFVVIFAALVMPWYVRNFLVARYVGFSSVGDYNLLFYEAAGVLAKSQGLSPQQARQELGIAYRERLDREKIDPTSTRAIRLQARMGSGILLAHPVLFIRVHFATSLNSLLPAGTGLLEILGMTSGNRGTLSVLQSQGFFAAVRYYFASNIIAVLFAIPELIYLIIRYLGCVVWAFWQFQTRRFNCGPSGWLIALTVAAFLLVAGPAAVARFRLPVEPLLNLIAGAGVAMVVGRGRLPENHTGVEGMALRAGSTVA
jgi:4-amino-4-deoxy-L-arabinose transferase-like glycosyltransferase